MVGVGKREDEEWRGAREERERVHGDRQGQVFLLFIFFFFKQKTAYEIGTGDWSSDVCLPISYLYTLTAGEAGYEAGNYDLIVFLGTNSARPLRYSFVVE